MRPGGAAMMANRSTTTSGDAGTSVRGGIGRARAISAGPSVVYVLAQPADPAASAREREIEIVMYRVFRFIIAPPASRMGRARRRAVTGGVQRIDRRRHRPRRQCDTLEARWRGQSS